MSPATASMILTLVGGYAGIGLMFALAFAWRGAGRIDPAAADGTRGFRLLIVPGAAALWPYLLVRWLRGAPPPVERNAHRAASSGARPA